MGGSRPLKAQATQSTKTEKQTSGTVSKTDPIANYTRGNGPVGFPPRNTCACGGGCPRCASATSSFPGGILRRKCACEGSDKTCTDCGGEKLRRQTQADVFSGDIPPIVHEVLSANGRPLETSTRAFMETQLGHDFSGVTVHTDARAGASAQAVNASAYTVGNHIVFGEGRYQPGDHEGRKLLAHELTHVSQNGPATTHSGPLQLGSVNSAEERQADAVANGLAPVSTPSSVANGRNASSVSVLRRQVACSPQIIRAITSSAPQGQKDVETALDRLHQYLLYFKTDRSKENMDPEVARVGAALKLHFGVFGDKWTTTIGEKIEVTLGKMGSNLGELGSNPTQVVCHSADAPVCEAGEAFVDQTSTTRQMNICGQFPDKEASKQVEILVHESAHVVNTDIKDKAYLSQRAYRFLSMQGMLTNAESYSSFIRHVAKGQDTKTKIPVDTFTDCGLTLPVLFEVMARAEFLNWKGYSGLADPKAIQVLFKTLWGWNFLEKGDDGSYKEKPTLAHIRTAYKATEEFFKGGHNITCTTDSDVCEKRHGIEVEKGNLKICRSGPVGQEPDGCPTCLLGALYRDALKGLGKVLADQMATKAVSIASDAADIVARPTQPETTVTPPKTANAEQVKPKPPIVSNRKAADRKRPPVKSGDHGCPIPELQEKLNLATGSKLKITGKFDEPTREAVTTFRESAGLGKKGDVDDATWLALHTAVPGEHGLPTGENFIPGKWGTGIDITMFGWNQELLPKETDFTGCWVSELEPGDPNEFTCCSSNCPGGLTGGAWLVKKDNKYGPDTVGIIQGVVDSYRDRSKLPCGYKVPQAMMLLRDPRVMKGVKETDRDALKEKSGSSEKAEYVRNVLLYTISKGELRCGKKNKGDEKYETKKYP